MNRDFSQKAPLQNQANMLASKGRFGDSMLVHMNPTEVDVLRRMTPGGQLTINPDTGQPEAFLPLILGLAGSLAGGAGLLGSSALLGSVGAGALGTAIGSTIETGSLKEGLKAGLISGLVGGAAGQLFKGAGDVASAAAKGTEEAAKTAAAQTVTDATTQAITSGPVMAGLPANIGQAAAPEVATAVVEEAVKPSLIQQIAQGGIPGDAAAGIKQIGTLDPMGNITAGAISGLTGQTLSDQFNMMNMDSGPMLDEDDEDFFVPVRARDRGVQFAGADIGGTGEFDYFSEPFGFDPLPPVGVKEGGMISGAARKFQEGGRVEEFAPRRSDYGGSTRQQQLFRRDAQEFEDMYSPISGNANSFTPTPSFNIPDYFRGPNAVGTNLDDMITEQVTEQIYTPRAQQMPSTSVSNIRGAGNVDFVDYNQRLLGDPVQTRDVTRRMTEDEIAARDAELAVMQAEEAANAPAAFQSDVQFDPLQFMRGINIGGRSGEMFMPEFGGDFNPFIPNMGQAAAPPSFDPTMPAMDFAAPVAAMATPQPSASVDTGFTPVQPVGATQPQFDPLSGMDFRGGRGGFNFGGMGGMSMGM